MTLKADAATLVERLRNAHRMRADSGATNNARHAAAVIARDLVDEASPELLRAALTLAVQPDGGQPPVPVVFGPQDVAAVVSADDVMGMVAAYSTGCTEWGRAFEVAQRGSGVPNLAECHRIERQIEATYKKLRAAVDQLARAAYVSGGAA
jgi:hypothetical protein